MKISTLAAALLLFGACATTPAKRTSLEDEAAVDPATETAAPPTRAAREKDPLPDAKEPARTPGVITRAELIKVLDGAPGRFLQHVQTEPRFVGGRFRGWKLASFYPGDERFAGVDLRAGDVVLSVNGHTIEQPEQLMEVWEALRFDRALVVVLERDGQARQLKFEIRD